MNSKQDDTCNDCGSAPRHRLGGSYCRYCREKGGERNTFVAVLDRDKLDAALGSEAADAFIARFLHDDAWLWHI